MELLNKAYDDSDGENQETPLHLIPLSKPLGVIKNELKVDCTPLILVDKSISKSKYLHPMTKEISVNLTYEEMFAPQVGPDNPFKTQQAKASKNTISGYVEPEFMSEANFEIQRKNFHVLGYASDPSVEIDPAKVDPIVGTLPDDSQDILQAKRKKVKAVDPSDIEGYLGPWAKYQDEEVISRPSEEMQTELNELLAKRVKKGNVEEKAVVEKSTLHISDAYDYQGRSFLHPPQDVGVSLKWDHIPDKCFLPKRLVHTYTGHTKGLSAIRWFPASAHLFLSCGLDAKIKLWEFYHKRRCIMTYLGHNQAVRDVCFNNAGTNFLSAGYDKFIKLWDTETGKFISKFTNRRVCFCVKFNPDEHKQHLFLAGTADKRIICWDTRTGDIVQEYDRHLGAINTITFIDNNRKFVTTSDDKTLRVWEWDIPVDTHYVADPSMHAIPAVTISPNKKWLACQSMENKVLMYQVMGGLRWRKKKTFSGHMVAGYACSPDFSPDLNYVISGDADGKLFIWDWRTTKIVSSFKAHDNVCISALWHPHETSKVLTAGWDSTIKLWD